MNRMCDAISRQAAIDKINERQRKLIYCFGFENDMVKIMDIAKSIITIMPSVQPDVIRCKDCKRYIRHDKRCGYWNHGVKPTMWCSQAERLLIGENYEIN